MSAREDILSLLNRYSYTVDTGDLDGFARLFENGEWHFEGSKPIRGRDNDDCWQFTRTRVRYPLVGDMSKHLKEPL